MKIKDLGTMNLSEINLDPVMQILPILKNMELEIIEEEAGSLRGKQHRELLLVELLKQS